MVMDIFEPVSPSGTGNTLRSFIALSLLRMEAPALITMRRKTSPVMQLLVTEISEIMTAGLVGCSACYESFSSELTAPLGVLHGQAVHRGKVSAGYRNKLERMRRLEELKKQLKAAVSEEEFEQAAALRDEIRELNTALGGR